MSVRTIPALLAVGLLAACQPAKQPAPAAAPHAAAAGQQKLVVFAAISLADVLKPINRAFEAAHPRAKVVLNLAGTQQLRAQLEGGAPCDVFLSASTDHSTALYKAGRLEPPETLVRNRLALAASPKSGKVKVFSDALKPGVRLVICAKEVPAGKYTEEALLALEQHGRKADAEALRHNVVSQEENVEAATSKVDLGEADCGLVYETDLKRTKLPAIDLPEPMQVEATYTKALAANAQAAGLARQYLAFLSSDEARKVLDEAGFRTAAPAP